jgi:purine-binding chemotaxis protein CheW
MSTLPLAHDPAAQQILAERARLLAAPLTDSQHEQGDELLAFRLGSERYSLPVAAVREVVPLQSYTALPATPPFVVGLINIRGRLLALLDIRPLLDIAGPPHSAGGFVLIIGDQRAELGLLADEVIEVRRGQRELAPTLAAEAGRGAAWVRGIDRRLTTRIDPALLLADPRLVVETARTAL